MQITLPFFAFVSLSVTAYARNVEPDRTEPAAGIANLVQDMEPATTTELSESFADYIQE